MSRPPGKAFRRLLAIVLAGFLSGALAACGGATHYSTKQIGAATTRCLKEYAQIEKYGTKAEQKAWDLTSGTAYNTCMNKGHPGLATQAKAALVASLPVCDKLWKLGFVPKASVDGMDCRYPGSGGKPAQYSAKMEYCTDGQGMKGHWLFVGPNDLFVIPGSTTAMSAVTDGDASVGGDSLIDTSISLCTDGLDQTVDDLD
jgi:hypothetical protein